MLTQIVMLRWQETATAEQRDAAVEALRALPGLIEELQSLRLVVDSGLRPDNFHVAMVTSFADGDAWERYQTHPEHLRVVKGAVAPILEAKAAVQFAGQPGALAESRDG